MVGPFAVVVAVIAVFLAQIEFASRILVLYAPSAFLLTQPSSDVQTKDRSCKTGTITSTI